ncbi:MAG TPA: prolipoprotein diacylglyceryl transferase [Stellaceae bacterium]|nr:prolipoprotein diacylglyceryl transferase [Stellaceae bacterium]
MPLFAIPFPPLDPIAISFGPLAIRWYALAYIVGLIVGWRYCLMLADRPPNLVTRRDIDDFLVWATLGVVLGGRLGFVLFYNLPYYLDHPLQMFELWHGGMSFHGGALGVTIAIILFARVRGILNLALSDIVVEAVPIGLFFGRIANFINDELWGRATTAWWGMQFPAELLSDPQKAAAAVEGAVKIDPRLINPEAIIAAYRDNPQVQALLVQILTPRHPSQLYEAACEGLLLFLLLLYGEHRGARRHPGVETGIFLAGYAVARMSGELFRQPDAQLGFLFHIGGFGVTMGELLSVPVLIGGALIIAWARHNRLPDMVER